MAVKGYKGIGMKGSVARNYDQTARATSMENYREWAGQLAVRIAPGSRVLEVAPGPGYLSIELARLGFQVTGLDISETFVDIVKKNAGEAGVNVDFRLGNASAMPFGEGTFDAIACTAAFKNFSEPARALQEMERVLVPGGLAWVLDMKRNITNREIGEYVAKNMKLRGWGAFSMNLIFKYFLRRRAYTREQMEAFTAQTRFQSHELEEIDIGFNLWLTK